MLESGTNAATRRRKPPPFPKGPIPGLGCGNPTAIASIPRCHGRSFGVRKAAEVDSEADTKRGERECAERTIPLPCEGMYQAFRNVSRLCKAGMVFRCLSISSRGNNSGHLFLSR